MKDLVLLPVKFIAVLLVLLSLCAGLQVFADFAQLAPELRKGFAELLPGLIAKSLYAWFLPLCSLAALGILSGVMLRKGLRWAMILSLFILLSAALFGAFMLHSKFFGLKTNATPIGFNVPEKSILAFDGGYAVAISDSPNEIRGILYHSSEPNSHFEQIESAVKNKDEKSIIIGERGVTIPLVDFAGSQVKPFMVPEYFNWPLKVLEHGSDEIFNYSSSSPIVSAARAGGFALVVVSLWLLVRLTRWQLFNAIIALCGLFGIFAIATFAGSAMAQSMFSFVPEHAKPFLLPGIYAILSLFLCGCALFLPSLKGWARDTAL